MVNSGSSANLLAIAALTNPECPNRLEPDDEVIVSALSWSTTVWPLVQHGLIPKIVDIDPATLNMDPAEVQAAIGPRTRAIMPVHVYGNPCEMVKIRDLADSHSLVVIEDCCEALGATYHGFQIGRLGTLATFSFYFSHHITTLEGGLVRANSQRMPGGTDLLRILRAHGWTRDLEDDSACRARYPDFDPQFLFVNAGYNLRPTEVAAAIGLVQLPKLADFVKRRRATATRLKEIFSGHTKWLSTQREERGGISSWFGFPIVVNKDVPFTAVELRQYFEENGIETRAILCGNIARQPGMQLWPHIRVGSLKHADHVMRSGFSIGCHQGMEVTDCNYVGEILSGFMQRRGCN